LHNCLTLELIAKLVNLYAFVLVHVFHLATNKRFIGFQLTSRSANSPASELALFESFAKSLKHKPCRLLGNAKSAVNLHAADTIFAANQHPKCRHPFVQSKRRVLKYRIDLERELFIAATAKPEFPCLNKVVLVGATTRADDLSIRPAELHGKLKAAVRIGEINDGLLLKSLVPSCHKYTPDVRVCQVYILPKFDPLFSIFCAKTRDFLGKFCTKMCALQA
jgi:hypothetical protein